MSERLVGMPRAWGRNPTATSRFRQRTKACWVFTILTALFAVLGVLDILTMVVGPDGPYALVGIVAWLAWLVLAAALFGLVDVYRAVPWSINLAMLAWGAFPATLIAGWLEAAALPIFGPSYTVAVTAGLVEEAVKLLGIILLAASMPALFRRPMGALICAMMAGLGFGFHENVVHAYAPFAELGAHVGAAEKIGTSLQTVLIRGFSSGAWAYLAFAGVASLGVVYFLSRTDLTPGRRLGVPTLLFLVAALLHFGTDMPLAENTIGVLASNTLQIALLSWLIVHAVRAERNWLPVAAAAAGPVVRPDEVGMLRTRRTRHQARTAISDRAARARTKTRQWAQIGYLRAIDEAAPGTQSERLASYVALLRNPVRSGRIPGQRRHSPSDERRPSAEPFG